MKKRCEDFEAQIVHFLNGELEEHLEDPLKAHLEACENCRKAEAEYRFLMETAASLPIAPVSGEASERVLKAVAGRRAGRAAQTAVAGRKRAGWRGLIYSLLYYPFPAYQVIVLALIFLAVALLWQGGKQAVPAGPVKPSDGIIAESPVIQEYVSPDREAGSSLWSWKGTVLARRDVSAADGDESIWRWIQGERIRKWREK